MTNPLTAGLSGADARSPAPWRPHHWLLLTLGYVVAVVYGLGNHGITAHEMYVAGIGRAMVEHGGSGMLLIGGEPWLEKPPLPHWIAAAFMAIGGVDEAWARAPFALAGFGTAIIVARLTSHYWGARVGLIAGLIQATSVYAFRFSRLAEADMLLAFLVTAAIGCAVMVSLAADRRTARNRWRVAFWVLLGLTNLVKGPALGMAIAGIALLGWIVWQRDWRQILRLVSPTGIVLFVLLVAGWPLLVWWQGYGEVLWREWQMHILGRLTDQTFVAQQSPWWHYATTIPWQLLPWTPLLPIGLIVVVRRAVTGNQPFERLLAAWLLLPVIALSAVGTKHHHYIMHALPAAAPIMALGLIALERWVGGLQLLRTQSARRLAFGMVGLMVVGGIASAINWPDQIAGVALVTTVVAFGLLVVFEDMTTGRSRQASTAFICTAVVAIAAFHTPFAPTIDLYAAPRDAALATAAAADPDLPTYLTGGTGVAQLQFYGPAGAVGVWWPDMLADPAFAAPPFQVISDPATTVPDLPCAIDATPDGAGGYRLLHVPEVCAP